MKDKIIRIIQRKYAEIKKYFTDNYRICLISLLIIVEIAVYSSLKAAPAGEAYVNYVNEMVPEYSSEFSFIFFENCKTSLVLILAGLIPIFIGPLFASFAVIYPLAGMMKYLLKDLDYIIILKGTLPHGVMEIPAIILSIMVSVLISKEVTLSIYEFLRDRTINQKMKNLLLLLLCWLLAIVPAFMLAAFVESYITPLLLA